MAFTSADALRRVTSASQLRFAFAIAAMISGDLDQAMDDAGRGRGQQWHGYS